MSHSPAKRGPLPVPWLAASHGSSVDDSATATRPSCLSARLTPLSQVPASSQNEPLRRTSLLAERGRRSGPDGPAPPPAPAVGATSAPRLQARPPDLPPLRRAAAGRRVHPGTRGSPQPHYARSGCAPAPETPRELHHPHVRCFLMRLFPLPLLPGSGKPRVPHRPTRRFPSRPHQGLPAALSTTQPPSSASTPGV
jgi:hypothetical protein